MFISTVLDKIVIIDRNLTEKPKYGDAGNIPVNTYEIPDNDEVQLGWYYDPYTDKLISREDHDMKIEKINTNRENKINSLYNSTVTFGDAVDSISANQGGVDELGSVVSDLASALDDLASTVSTLTENNNTI